MNIFEIHQQMTEKLATIQGLTGQLLDLHAQLKQAIPTMPAPETIVTNPGTEWVAPAPPTNPEWVASTTMTTDPDPEPDPIVDVPTSETAEPPATE